LLLKKRTARERKGRKEKTTRERKEQQKKGRDERKKLKKKMNLKIKIGKNTRRCRNS
jgi:hypothetical protein